MLQTHINTMEELKLAQFYNCYRTSKAKTSDILKSVNVMYCIPDNIPGQQDLRKWSGYTSLHFAVKAVALELTNELLDMGADLCKQGTKDGCTPLHVALNEIFHSPGYNDKMSPEKYKSYRNEELQQHCILNALLSKQVDVNNTKNPMNKYGVSHLHIACIVDHAEAVELFAKAKVPLDQSISYDPSDDPDDRMNMKQFQGYTPLHCAITYSSVKAADILLQYGADVHVKNEKGMNCVHLLIERIILMTDYIRMGMRTLCMPYVEETERIENIIKLVLRTKLNNIFADDTGISALHLACTLGDQSIIEHYLMKHNVDVNVQIKDESEYWPGWTPLHFAACFHVNTMILLMKSGADITIQNLKGETALDLCAKRFTLAEVQLVLSTEDKFRNIVLSDDCTKLSDLLPAMTDFKQLNDFVQKLKDVNLTVPSSSPIWAGYSLLHLAVSLNEKTILCEDIIRFELPEAKEADVIRYNCTEEEKALYWKRVKLFLECGCNSSLKNAKGETPIHLAFRMLKQTTVKELLGCSGDNISDNNNLSHLHIACAVGDLVAASRYVDRGANVNSRVKRSFDWYGNQWERPKEMISVREKSTPLHVAVAFGHKNVVEYLLKSNADVYAQDSLDLTPVHLSMSIGGYWRQNLARVFFELMPELRDSVSKAGLSHLHAAAAANYYGAVQRMLRKGADVNCAVDANVREPPFLVDLAGKTPLHVAMKKSENAISAFLEAGANVHAKDLKGVSVLQHSINQLHKPWIYGLVRMLKQGKYDVDGSGITLLHFACGTYDVEWAEELLKNGADVNARISAEGRLKGATPLYLLFNSDVNPHTAVDLTTLLLKRGADVTIECRGCTPIHLIYQASVGIFLRDGYYEWKQISQCANLMLESQKSYDVNPISCLGFSHFHYACVKNNVETVGRFLNHGVDVNHTVDPFADRMGGFSPLHVAMNYENMEIAYLLLESGADLNAEDAYGNKPLQVAIKRNIVNLPLIETMLSRGADIHGENSSGETLLDCLLRYGGLTLEALELFIGHGCFMSSLDVHQGIIASAMLAAAPNNFLPILKRLAETQSAIQNGFNVIQSVVAVENQYQLEVDDYLSSIEFLIGIGCDIDRQDAEGKTALHKAVSFCNLPAVDALFQLGADVNVVDCTNRCPFSDIGSAIDTSHYNIMRIMKTVFCSLWKMNFIGLDVNDSNFQFIERTNVRMVVDSLLEQSCHDELKKAKATEIFKNITVNDFLSEFGAVCAYPRLCPKLRAIVDEFFSRTLDLRQEFPQFSGLLAMQYRKARARKALLQPAGEAIVSICQISFPDLCLEAILEFFTDRDMKMLITSVNELFN